LIALPLIAHTQKLSNDCKNSKELDSLSVERRLVVLGVKSLDYYIYLNDINSTIIRTQSEVIIHNESYIGQLQGDLSHLKQVNENEIRHKKKWRKATLYSVGLNAIFLATLYVLNR
jgi:hypothetical protein